MAFSDPQTLTIATVANPLARTGSSNDSGVFTKDDGSVKLSFQHTYNKRVRRTVRVDHSKIAADPLQPGTNQRFSMSVQFILDVPAVGYTNAEAKQIADALTAYLTASSGEIGRAHV